MEYRKPSYPVSGDGACDAEEARRGQVVAGDRDAVLRPVKAPAAV